MEHWDLVGCPTACLQMHVGPTVHLYHSSMGPSDPMGFPTVLLTNVCPTIYYPISKSHGTAGWYGQWADNPSIPTHYVTSI